MKIICPKCQKTLAGVEPTVLLNISVHCSFCGHEFGVVVDTPLQVEFPPASPDEPTSPTSKESVSQA